MILDKIILFCIFARSGKIIKVKHTILYVVVFLFSIALCYETICYCYQKINDNSYCEHTDLDCEENKTESESSEKKEKEKTDMFDKLFLDKIHPSLVANIKQQQFKSHLRFSTNDYSKVIYSPPEPPLL
jgi:hypothetical protein